MRVTLRRLQFEQLALGERWIPFHLCRESLRGPECLGVRAHNLNDEKGVSMSPGYERNLIKDWL